MANANPAILPDRSSRPAHTTRARRAEGNAPTPTIRGRDAATASAARDLPVVTERVGSLLGVERDPHRSRRGAIVGLGPGRPRQGQAEVGAERPPSTRGHLPGAGLAHRARPLEGLPRDPEQALL